MTKRKDSKGRNLNQGESQRKDGKYEYKYTDLDGTRKSVYSWRLVASDKAPSGRAAADKPLREKERDIQRRIDSGIVSSGKTVAELLDDYLMLKEDKVRASTYKGYVALSNVIKKYAFSKLSIDSVKPTSAKLFIKQLKKDGLSYGTISNAFYFLESAFETAAADDEILKNPLNFKISQVLSNDTEPRQALSREDEQKLLDFLSTDTTYGKYYDVVFILLNTGLRISEFCGLTFDDVDFERMTLTVDHQLLITAKPYAAYIEKPKSRSGYRTIAMTSAVAEAFRRFISRRPTPEAELKIDGYTGFLAINNHGFIKTGIGYDHIFSHIVTKYNKIHEDKLPSITPHMLRHTFCTRMCELNLSPKALQYIMGHSDVSITMNRYAHSSAEVANAEMLRLIEQANK